MDFILYCLYIVSYSILYRLNRLINTPTFTEFVLSKCVCEGYILALRDPVLYTEPVGPTHCKAYRSRPRNQQHWTTSYRHSRRIRTPSLDVFTALRIAVIGNARMIQAQPYTQWSLHENSSQENS